MNQINFEGAPDTAPKPKTSKLNTLLLSIIPFALLAFALNWIAAIWLPYDRGTFGDAFGMVNALFSGAAMAFVIYAVVLQREELTLVKDERDDTRRLLEAQQTISSMQRNALDRQIFDLSFFNLVGLISKEKEGLQRTRKELSNGYMITMLERTVSECQPVLEAVCSHLVAKKELGEFDFSQQHFTSAVAASRKVEPILALLVAVSRMVDGREELSPEDRAFYQSTVNALIDRELATVWAFRCCYESNLETASYVIFLNRFAYLQLDLSIRDEICRSFRQLKEADESYAAEQGGN